MYQERTYSPFHISPSGERLVNQSSFVWSDLYMHSNALAWKQ